jgi:putative transposase
VAERLRARKQTIKTVICRSYSGECCFTGSIAKKVKSPAAKKEVVRELMAHRLSIRQACRVVALSRNAYYHQRSEPADEKDIEDTLTALAEKHHRWGFWKLFHRFRKQHEELSVNHKRLYRIYCKLKLNLRRKGKKRLPEGIKQSLTVPQTANVVWSMDFMSDALIDGRRFRTFNGPATSVHRLRIDDFNREGL